MSTGTTSIQVNEMMPYVLGGQIKGILAGMPGAAEYEELIGVKGIGTSGMDAQSVAHFVIVLFIFLGNLGYFIERNAPKNIRGHNYGYSWCMDSSFSHISYFLVFI